MSIIIAVLKLFLAKIKWRKRNRNNHTVLVNVFPMELAEIGKQTYGQLCVFAQSKEAKLKIGNYCSIGPNVSFLLSVEHQLDRISTYPFRVMCLGEKYEAGTKGDIIIEDDVWIGCGATIMSGVHIGKGAVIAAGAVVTKDVEPYAIVAGVPAKTIKMRFDDDRIKRLMEINYEQIDEAIIKEYNELLYKKEPSVDDIEKIVKCTQI